MIDTAIKDEDRVYKLQFGIGRTKYSVWAFYGHYHSDGSKQFEPTFFTNVKKRDKYIKELLSYGYKEKEFDAE